ncbi:MAG: DUF2179 domain-containing protein, partial [Chloroflexota bacterium]|nr:DUF2179 domain-containing protein [Chloroflexota bacterium]
RTYVWLITLQLISWGVKLSIHPTPAPDWATIVERASIGYIPGVWTVTTVGMMYGAMAALAVGATIPAAWREAMPRPLRWLARLLRRATGPSPQRTRPQEQMATIITSDGQAVASQIIQELGRGVTALQGAGMYTGEARDVLLCAVTEVQMSHLEQIVQQIDPQAFVVVNKAMEVRGRGFSSFDVPD